MNEFIFQQPGQAGELAMWWKPEQMDHNCVWPWVRLWEQRSDLFSSSSSSFLSSDKPIDMKPIDKQAILKPFGLVTAKPKQERRPENTTSAPAINSMSLATLHVSLKESHDSLMTDYHNYESDWVSQWSRRFIILGKKLTHSGRVQPEQVFGCLITDQGQWRKRTEWAARYGWQMRQHLLSNCFLF